MKQISKLLLILWVLVITDPYQGINYQEINVYDVNYCSEYCYNQNDDYSDYYEDEEPEEYDEEEQAFNLNRDKPLVFPVDFWKSDN